MGQYRIAFYYKFQLGFIIEYTHGYGLTLGLPFFDLVIGTSDHAHGLRLFNWYNN